MKKSKNIKVISAPLKVMGIPLLTWSLIIAPVILLLNLINSYTDFTLLYCLLLGLVLYISIFIYTKYEPDFFTIFINKVKVRSLENSIGFDGSRYIS